MPNLRAVLRQGMLALTALLTVSCLTVLLVTAWLWLRGGALDQRTWHEPPNLRGDASRLDPVRVNRVLSLSPDSAMALGQLRRALVTARTHHLAIAVAGARHSMGGHSAAAHGLVIDMLPHNRLRLDSAFADAPGSVVLHAQAGARWSEIIPFLDKQGLAVMIMQSNNLFTVGGTLSVNAHGWQHNLPPFAHSVHSLRLFTARGEILNCSRTENADLFHGAVGGYGLFGVVLEATLKVVPNALYRAERTILPSHQYAAIFKRTVDGDPDLGLVYGRLSIAPGSFLKEAILTRYRHVTGHLLPLSESEPSPTLQNPNWLFNAKRRLFLASVGSDFGKSARWFLEKTVGGESSALATRNRIMNDPIDLFENFDSTRTQLLHEYFVPRDSLEAFLTLARTIIPSHEGDLLNLTVRNLEADGDAFLNYARQPVFSLVMLFSQNKAAGAEMAMQAMTRALIDAALAKGGTYYLPYRKHATPEQLLRAYPMFGAFLTLKKRYDPEGLFQNEFYRQYAAINSATLNSDMTR